MSQGQLRRSGRAIKFPHVRALDGVRGLASLAVVAHHCLSFGLPPIQVHTATKLLESCSEYGAHGVDLFFVLSGYLITSLLLLARRLPNYFRNFYWKRVFRILPALILVLFASHFMGYTPWIGVILALLFVANIMNFWGLAEIGPYWSLSIEEQFYLVWPFVVRRSRPRSMLRLLVLLIVGTIVVRFVSVALHHGRMHYTFMHCDGLAWGALLALLALRARCPFRPDGGFSLWRKAGPWLIGLGLLGSTTAIWLQSVYYRDFGLMLTSIAPLFTGFLLYLITHKTAPLTWFLASPPLRFLGDVSYMVYLSHSYFLWFYDTHVTSWSSHPTESGLYLRFAVITAVTLLASAISLYLYERPVARLRRYFVRPE